MIVYGRNPVGEALRGRRAHTVKDIWASGGAAREPWLEGVKVKLVSGEELERRCGSNAHQGICAEAGGYPYVGSEELLKVSGEPLLLALDQIVDPQNLGSICRTAECAGASGVIIPERRSADVTPAVCKASAGAVEHLRIAKTRNIADFLGDARERGYWCYGASTSAEAVPYDQPDYTGRVVLVLGSEGSGLRPRVAGACDQLIALGQHGQIQSLGVSAAAAALLYGILHGRSKGLDKAP
ncbi:MAG TPA: 23S rRNA (guanosine(2251)-2'-O)-methyltransferase RlmB [Solirubrobacteraceae bacterium]